MSESLSQKSSKKIIMSDGVVARGKKTVIRKIPTSPRYSEIKTPDYYDQENESKKNINTPDFLISEKTHDKKHITLWLLVVLFLACVGWALFSLMYRAHVSFRYQETIISNPGNITAVAQYSTGNLPYYVITTTLERSELVPGVFDEKNIPNYSVVSDRLEKLILDAPTLYDRLIRDLPNGSISYRDGMLRSPITETITPEPEGLLITKHQQVSLLFFKKSELLRYLDIRYGTDGYKHQTIIKDNFYISPDTNTSFISVGKMPPDLSLKITGDILFLGTVDQTLLRQQLVSVTTDDCYQILGKTLEITDVSCNISPKWMKKTPKKTDHIMIHINNK